jgi:hypothetical protein
MVAFIAGFLTATVIIGLIVLRIVTWVNSDVEKAEGLPPKNHEPANTKPGRLESGFGPYA